jgi:hypothetical protein
MKGISLLLLLATGICGCSKPLSVTDSANLEADGLTSSLSISGGAMAAVERTYTAGGATGDTLHKAWICQTDLSDCKQVAIIDTHDGPPPVWKATAAGLELVVGPSDVIWGFSNFSYLPGPNYRSTKIRLVERPH